MWFWNYYPYTFIDDHKIATYLF